MRRGTVSNQIMDHSSQSEIPMSPIVQARASGKRVFLQRYSCSRSCRDLAAHLSSCLPLGQVDAQILWYPSLYFNIIFSFLVGIM